METILSNAIASNLFSYLAHIQSSFDGKSKTDFISNDTIAYIHKMHLQKSFEAVKITLKWIVMVESVEW